MTIRPFSALRACLLILAITICTSGAEPFHGNTRSRIFHQSSCRYYSCPNCTAKFATAREAVNSGYRPCALCQPDGTRSTESTKIASAYVGNIRSHKFHRSSCRYAGCANCTAKFRSRDEAIAAGYVPGGCCSP